MDTFLVNREVVIRYSSRLRRLPQSPRELDPSSDLGRNAGVLIIESPGTKSASPTYTCRVLLP